jgi:hypothetical protein
MARPTMYKYITEHEIGKRGKKISHCRSTRFSKKVASTKYVNEAKRN